MQLGQNPYAYGGGGGGSGGGDGNMGQNPYAYAQHPMMFSMPEVRGRGRV